MMYENTLHTQSSKARTKAPLTLREQLTVGTDLPRGSILVLLISVKPGPLQRIWAKS